MVAFTVHLVDKANSFCPMNIGYKAEIAVGPVRDRSPVLNMGLVS